MEKDYKQALFWYNKAAKHGEKWGENAENGLGVMYEDGLGVKQDYKKAIYWYKRAANHGNKSSFVNLGILHEYGRGVPKNCRLAIEFYEKAKALGHEKAGRYIKETTQSCK